MGKTLEQKIEQITKEALDEIMDIVSATNNAEGSGGVYDGNPREEIKTILESLIKPILA